MAAPVAAVSDATAATANAALRACSNRPGPGRPVQARQRRRMHSEARTDCESSGNRRGGAVRSSGHAVNRRLYRLAYCFAPNMFARASALRGPARRRSASTCTPHSTAGRRSIARNHLSTFGKSESVCPWRSCERSHGNVAMSAVNLVAVGGRPRVEVEHRVHSSMVIRSSAHTFPKSFTTVIGSIGAIPRAIHRCVMRGAPASADRRFTTRVEH